MMILDKVSVINAPTCMNICPSPPSPQDKTRGFWQRSDLDVRFYTLLILLPDSCSNSYANRHITFIYNSIIASETGSIKPHHKSKDRAREAEWKAAVYHIYWWGRGRGRRYEGLGYILVGNWGGRKAGDYYWLVREGAEGGSIGRLQIHTGWLINIVQIDFKKCLMFHNIAN